MNRRTVCVLVAFAVMVFSSGCASIISGKTQNINLQSDPSGAAVLVDGVQMGLTPLSTVIVRRDNTIVEFKKPGYEDAKMPLRTGLNPWMGANVIWSYFSTTGTTIDYATGSAYAFDRDNYYINLKPLVNGPRASLEEQSEVTRYILINYNDVSAQLAKGQGDNLTALLSLLKVPDEQRSVAIAAIKDAWVKNTNPVDFAKSIEASVRTKPVEAPAK